MGEKWQGRGRPRGENKLHRRHRLVALGARSLASMADQGASAAITFLCSVFVGRLLGAEALGVFALTSVLVMAMRQLQAGAVLDPMSVYGARRKAAERGRYLGFLLLLQGGWVGGLTVACALASLVLRSQGMITAGDAAAILAALLFANAITLQYLIRRQFYVDEQPYQALLQSVAFLLLCLGALAMLAAVGGGSLPRLYLVLAACSTLIVAVQGPRIGAGIALPTTAERRRFMAEHRRYGGWSLLTVPVSMASYQGFFLVSGAVLPVSETGYLKAADALIAPFGQMAIGVSMLFVPLLSRRLDRLSGAAAMPYALRLLAAMAAIALLYAAAVWLLGASAIALIFGDRLAGAATLVAPMALTSLPMGAAVPAAVMLSACGRADLRFLAHLAAAVISLAVGIPLVLGSGLIGAAWAICLAQGVLAASLWAVFLWHRREPSQEEGTPRS